MNDRPRAPGPAPAGPERVVGIGASAGGIEAMDEFFAHLPAGSPAAFLIVEHLDPRHTGGMLPQVLQRIARMPVCAAADGMPIEPGQAYVIQPNRVLTVADGHLRLRPPDPQDQIHATVDQLFVSLAAQYGARAIGVVLSGMGTDGTQGLRALRASGALTLAQRPESAQFGSMPRSAIDAGCVDVVGMPAELAVRLGVELAQARAPTVPAGPAQAAGAAGLVQPAEPLPQPSPPLTAEAALEAVVQLLAARGLHDFSQYKRSTLRRRIERRAAIHRLDGLPAYLALLQGNAQELALLSKEMLIGVTSFFRDPEVWESLRDRQLPRLLAERAPDDRLRAWVAGCSTGQEAYSLAIVLSELRDAPGAPDALPLPQIFATDLSTDAIEVARRGRFPATLAREVSAERLARCFTPADGGYRIAESLRRTIVFAPHDLTRNPPFTQLDLVSCRNLLIYLTAPLQRRVLKLFHYSLKPGGLLVLGSSESVGTLDDLFESIEGGLHIFRRRSGEHATIAIADLALTPPRAAPFLHPEEPPLAQTPDVPAPGALPAAADALLLQAYAPAAVLVDARGDIVYINGRTGRYLEPAAGRANWNIHVMAREGLRAALAAALQEATEGRAPVQLRALRVEDGDGRHRVDVTVQPLSAPRALEGMLLVVFRDTPPPPRRRRGGAGSQALEEQLQAAQADVERLREEMRTSTEELRATNEELQSTNEELQSTNEELQSTNEELTSSQEEAQSMNEELQAVNAQLRSKLEELATAQNDFRNLLNATEIATLFLDARLNVRRYTERATQLFRLRDGDIGRPLADLASTLDDPTLLDDVREVIRTLAPRAKDVAAQDGHWYRAHIKAYRTQEDSIQGVVITFFDITEAKRLEASLRANAAGGAAPG